MLFRSCRFLIFSCGALGSFLQRPALVLLLLLPEPCFAGPRATNAIQLKLILLSLLFVLGVSCCVLRGRSPALRALVLLMLFKLKLILLSLLFVLGVSCCVLRA